jgi:spermidine/putrescine transport system substrate-binding protein
MTHPHADPDSVKISRRRLLQGSALAGVAAFVAACRSTGGGATASAAASTEPSVAASGEPSAAPSAAASEGPLGGKLNFANWTAYIDLTITPGADGKIGTSDDGTSLPSPTLDQFTQATGVEVNYQEAINSNEEFFGTDLQGPISQGKSTGWDIITMTDWMAARLIRLGWVETLDTTGMKNFPANLEKVLLERSFDVGAKMTAPWQSGMTGLGFDSAKTGDLTSVNAFWDPKFKGKVDYLDEMRDTIGLSAIKLGFDPATITDDQFNQALAQVETAIKDKQVRTIKGNDYLGDLASGDVVLAMSWSGDIIQLKLSKDSMAFNVPTEGGMLWTDNMMIPKGAENVKQALAFIDFYYDPAIAAQVEDFVNYVCPVVGAKEALLKINPDNANNPLMFPPPDVLQRLHVFRGLDETEEKKYTEAWNNVIGL